MPVWSLCRAGLRVQASLQNHPLDLELKKGHCVLDGAVDLGFRVLGMKCSWKGSGCIGFGGYPFRD